MTCGGPFCTGHSSKHSDDPARYVEEIRDIYQTLNQLQDFKPCPAVNKIFGRLVSICSKIPEADIVEVVLGHLSADNILAPLWQLCSLGEYQLELYWAQKIARCESENKVMRTLRSFPYHENFVELVRMELHAILSVTTEPLSKVAFIGSGPFPLTSICLMEALEQRDLGRSPVTITNVDSSHEAIDLSSSLCSRIDPSCQALRFVCKNAMDDSLDLRGLDVVYLAALVGSTEKEKEQIVGIVARKMRPGSLLVLRSSHSLRRVLYPPVNVTSSMAGGLLEPLLVVHPCNQVINSIVITRVRGPQ